MIQSQENKQLLYCKGVVYSLLFGVNIYTVKELFTLSTLEPTSDTVKKLLILLILDTKVMAIDGYSNHCDNQHMLIKYELEIK